MEAVIDRVIPRKAVFQSTLQKWQMKCSDINICVYIYYIYIYMFSIYIYICLIYIYISWMASMTQWT